VPVETPLLEPELARRIAAEHGTPCYVYSQAWLEMQAARMLAFPHAYGLTVRFAMKACPSAAILRIFKKAGLHIDASSGWEVHRALRAGFEPAQISLSTQELPDDFAELLSRGVEINACSLEQLECIGRARAGHAIGLRFNPGRGSGGTGKTNVGGSDSSFGIWYEWADQAAAIAATHRLRVVRIHTHIGSGSDPAVWQSVADASLALVGRFPSATVLNLGGGYKVARVSTEKETSPVIVGAPVRAAFEKFAAEHGRKLHLEIEPGTFLVANAGGVLASVTDVVRTDQRTFVKLDSGMTEILRPSLYGAQHPITFYPVKESASMVDTVVVGHCCESGDLITCAPGDAETIAPRRLPKVVSGDLALIGGTGAYCASMSAKNYNSFPEAPEVLVGRDQAVHLIRRRQTLDQMLANEVVPEGL
jgi:diaminopimelate decarboxylase